MQRAEVLALRGLSVGQEAEVMDAEGDYRAAALYYASAVKVLMAALTAAATASAGDGSCVQRWADEQLHARVSDRSRDYLKRAEKLSRFARISERSEHSVRSRRRPKQQQQSSAATVEPPQPPTAILVEIPVFVPTPPPLPPPPPPPPPPQQPQAPLPTTAEGAIGATIVRGLTQAVDALARALEQPGRAERFPRNAPYAVTGDHGETFEFVDRAPWTFSRLRHSARLPERLYLSSFVESSQPLVPLRATGRSGSVFLGTPDGRFIVKTINDEEHACLLGITDDYFVHVTSVAASLLVRFYGHFSLRLIGAGTGSPLDVAVGTVLHVVVMENLFPADKSQILECYDLKGSTYKRVATEKEKQRADRVLKDLDLSTGPRHAFRFSRSRKDLFIDAIENDSLFLERHGIMDYSLLIGVKKKPKDLAPPPSSPSAAAAAPGTEEAWPSSPFRCDGGGFASYGGDPAAEVYYVGIIDILQPFNVRKRVEYTLKSVLTGGKEEISATDPQRYGSRFREFLSRVIIEDSSHVSRQPRPDYLHDAPSSP